MILTIASMEECEELFTMERVLVFKNSTRCGISQRAMRELRSFAEGAEDTLPIRVIDVIANRDLSELFAKRTGIGHHSPQAVFLVRGLPVWNASHFDITEPALREAAETQR